MVNKRREGPTFYRQWPFSQGDLKRRSPALTTNTVTAKRRGGPQHMLEGKKTTAMAHLDNWKVGKQHLLFTYT